MTAPKTLVINGEALLRVKENGSANPETLEYIRKEADRIVDLKPISVTERKLAAPTGDKHDYASTGIYWWPNPDTENGLPYIRRDGEVNPETRDGAQLDALADRLVKLALAAFFFGDERYQEAAREQLRVWYLDKELGMNPNGKFAQGIPGICLGRGIGLIEFRKNIDVIDAIEILYSQGAISDEMLADLKAWFVKLTDWMITSENGIDEDNQHNNHGVWYDAQIAAMALFTGRVNLAKRVARTSYPLRQCKHIMDDGSQPHELARTRAMHYSLFNAMGLITVGILAKRVGDERYLNDPRLPLTYEFIKKHYENPSQFPYREIRLDTVPGMLATAAYMFDGVYPEKKYADGIDASLKSEMYYSIVPFGVDVN